MHHPIWWIDIWSLWQNCVQSKSEADRYSLYKKRNGNLHQRERRQNHLFLNLLSMSCNTSKKNKRALVCLLKDTRRLLEVQQWHWPRAQGVWPRLSLYTLNSIERFFWNKSNKILIQWLLINCFENSRFFFIRQFSLSVLIAQFIFGLSNFATIIYQCWTHPQQKNLT